ncbi:MAG: acyl-CoA thioesterase [Prevotellaceae bacterium]|jgi:acyl-CoA thioester hydrolase|nr:acyl-CoA thioesterase [Prevotellaceae bacterium]
MCIIYDVQIRARYNETDKMGVVYHANYINYYEIARTEMLRNTGTYSYREMESDGIMMPVIEVQSLYILPAYYDELLTVRVTIKELPTAKMTFFYEIFNEKQELLNTGKTVLAFINSATRRPCRPPQKLINCLKAKL